MLHETIPDSKVPGANTGPIWGRQDPGGPHVGPMNFVIWDAMIGLNCTQLNLTIDVLCGNENVILIKFSSPAPVEVI